MMHLIENITYFTFLYILDTYLLSKYSDSIRWFYMHVITNFIVCLTTLPDVIIILMDPYTEINSLMTPKNIILMSHLYHVLIFNVSIIDWIHHIIMSLMLLIPYVYPASTITNYLLFFLNGLPGGIDYIMLMMVKFDMIDRITEKYINSLLNIYFRGPGIVIGAYIVYLNWLTGRLVINLIVLLFTIVGLLWNAQYFTYRVVANYGKNLK